MDADIQPSSSAIAVYHPPHAPPLNPWLLVCAALVTAIFQSLQRVYFTPLLSFSLFVFMFQWLVLHGLAITCIIRAMVGLIRYPKQRGACVITIAVALTGLFVWWFAPVSDSWLGWFPIKDREQYARAVQLIRSGQIQTADGSFITLPKELSHLSTDGQAWAGKTEHGTRVRFYLKSAFGYQIALIFEPEQKLGPVEVGEMWYRKVVKKDRGIYLVLVVDWDGPI